jgi:rhodanese-related sulfurtransferase
MSLAYCLAIVALLAQTEARPAPASSAARHNAEFTKDTLAVVKKNVSEGKAVLVDVRSLQEWNKGHIAGSVFLPVDSLAKKPDPKMLAQKLPQKKFLYTFCVVGMRAKTAAIKLEQQGYTVRALKPGYDDLIKAGFPMGEVTKSVERASTNEDTRQRNAR